MAGNLDLDKVDDEVKFKSVLTNVKKTQDHFTLLVTFRIIDIIELWQEGKNITKDSIDGD